MTNPSPAGPPRHGSAAEGDGPESWLATRALTQVARDEDTYLGTGRRHIGRLVGENRHEIFVACEPGLALRQQFEHLQPEFIAIHDVAASASRQLVAGIAKASNAAVQRLVIRRQGQGQPLATLEFTEVPTAEGGRLRVYATEGEADPALRESITRTLLAFSTLGVFLVGDAPGAAISGVFKPLHGEMVAGPWPNRHLLLLPLSTANALVTQGMELSRGTGVIVRTTPQVARPADAWKFISSTWARVREETGVRAPDPRPQAHAPAAQAHATAAQPPAPLPMRPMPQVPGAAAASPAGGADVLSRYVEQLGRLTGLVSCCIFDMATGRDLVHAGARPGPVALAEHGAELMATMLTTGRVLGLGHALPDAAVTLGAHHLLLRPVPRHPGLALHAVLDKTTANLTLARLQIGRMDALFDEAPAV